MHLDKKFNSRTLLHQTCHANPSVYIKSNRIKSNQIYFSVAGNNNTQYDSIDLKYEIPLLKEWMVRQADTNTIPNLRLTRQKTPVQHAYSL